MQLFVSHSFWRKHRPSAVPLSEQAQDVNIFLKRRLAVPPLPTALWLGVDQRQLLSPVDKTNGADLRAEIPKWLGHDLLLRCSETEFPPLAGPPWDAAEITHGRERASVGGWISLLWARSARGRGLTRASTATPARQLRARVGTSSGPDLERLFEEASAVLKKAGLEVDQ
jgi:hypothetical protein